MIKRIKRCIPQRIKNFAYLVTRSKKIHNNLTFGVDLSKHCNLRCRGCDHFSCISEEKFADFNSMEKDFIRLNSLFGDRVERIKFLGGEPLLNPEICSFLEMGRRIFPNSEIVIISNGTLLLGQNDRFWEVCKNNNITISVTRYPIQFDYDSVCNLAKKKGVKYSYHSDTDEEVKEMYCAPIDMDGKQNPQISYKICGKANYCVTLENGRLYTCTMIPNIEIFNKYFNKNLIVSDEDYIDIYSIDRPDLILEKLSRPVPFCRYCDNLHFRRGIPWEATKGDIREWT